MFVLVLFCCDKDHEQKPPGEKRVLLQLKIVIRPYRSLRKEPTSARSWGRGLEEHCLVAHSSWLGKFVFLFIPGPLSWDGIAHSGLGLHVSIIYKENAQLAHSEDIFSAEISSSQMTPVSVKLKIN